MIPRDYNPSNVSYVAIKREDTTKGTPEGTPDLYVPIQDFNVQPDLNKGLDTRLAGTNIAQNAILQGRRKYEGTMNFYNDPNFNYHIWDMTIKMGTTVDNGDGTFTTTSDVVDDGTASNEPNSYTVDKAINGRVFRFVGVEGKELPDSYDEGDNTGHFEMGVVARNHFYSSKVVSVTGSGPYTLVLSEAGQQDPTNMLVAGDTMTALDVSTGSYVDFTIDSITNGTTIEVTEDISALAVNDQVYIKAQPLSGITWFSEQPIMGWINHSIKKGATLGTVAEFCAEQDSTFTLTHNIMNDTGDMCAGTDHPRYFRRTTVDAELTINRVMDKGTDYSEFLDNEVVVYQKSWDVAGNNLTVNFYTQAEGGEITYPNGELEAQTFTAKPIKDPTTGKSIEVSLTNHYDTV